MCQFLNISHRSYCDGILLSATYVSILTLSHQSYCDTILFSGDGNDMNPALPDTSMKLGRYVYKHELFEIFSLANQNYSNFQDGGSEFQDDCQNKY